MISSKVVQIIEKLDNMKWTYRDGKVYTANRTRDEGDKELYLYILDLLKAEDISPQSYIVTFNENDHTLTVHNKSLDEDYIMRMCAHKWYRPMDIYIKLVNAINFFGNDNKSTVKHALNGFYGMYVDTDNFTANKVYSGDSKVYFKNASYIAATMSELSNISKNPKFPAIKKVISNKPYTIVLWLDGTKTIVKQQPGETKYDPEKGLAMCIVKKMYGNNKWYDIFKRNLDPKYTKRKKVK